MKNLHAFVFAFATTLAQAATVAGEIKLVKGSVFIIDATSKVVADPEGKRGRSTQKGSKFYVGETIQTKSDGKVKLEFIEGKNEVVLGPDTALTIDKTSGGKKTTELNLARGEVRANVKEKYDPTKGETFQVKTPNAVAGVRGTIFVSRFDQKSFKSDFATQEGKVFVKTGGGSSVEVSAGMFTSAGKGGTLESPKPLSANPELKQSVEALGSDSGTASSATPDANSPVASSGTPNGDTKAKPTEASESAPLTREKVAAKDGGDRKPAGENGAPLVKGEVGPKLMGESSAPPPPPAGTTFSELNRFVDSKVDRLVEVTQQQNQINNTLGRLRFKIQ